MYFESMMDGLYLEYLSLSRKSKDVLNDFLSHYQFSGELGSENTISELVFSLCGPAGDFCHGNIIECDGGSI